jgi:hypothetical protein
VVRVTFDFNQFAIFDVGQHPTAAVTAGPGRPGGCAYDVTTAVAHFLLSCPGFILSATTAWAVLVTSRAGTRLAAAGTQPWHFWISTDLAFTEFVCNVLQFIPFVSYHRYTGNYNLQMSVLQVKKTVLG